MSEVAVYQPQAELAVPSHRDIDSWTAIVADIIKIANVIADTPFVPDGIRGSAPAVAAAILAGREMGLGMMTSLANIDVIRGKPTQKPLLMRGMIQSHGHKWEDVEVTDTRAVVRGCRKGESSWTEVTFTADQAKKGGIDLGKYPADKLYARASSRLAKRKFADVIMGMPYTADDLEDGIADEDIPAVAMPPAAAVEPPKTGKPRTARRRSAATQTASPAQAAHPPAAHAGAPVQGAGEALPPLPGEEEERPTAAAGASASASTAALASAQTAPDAPDDTDHDTPGTVTMGPNGQLTRIWATLTSDLGFGSDEKDQARQVCAQIVGRDLESSKDLSFNEAKTIIDTLSQVGSRDDLTALLIAMDKESAGGE